MALFSFASCLSLKSVGNENIDISMLKKYQPFLADLGNIIIPTTKTKGAGEDTTIRFVFKAFVGGVANFNLSQIDLLISHLNSVTDMKFIQMHSSEKYNVISEIDEAAYSALDKNASGVEQAWIALKCAFVAGYYTGKVGGSEELKYDPVPGEFYNFKLEKDYVQTSNNAFGFPIGVL